MLITKKNHEKQISDLTESYEKEITEIETDHEIEIRNVEAKLEVAERKLKSLKKVLWEIIDQRTPSANATVNRMVNIAEAALDTFEDDVPTESGGGEVLSDLAKKLTNRPENVQIQYDWVKLEWPTCYKD